MSLPISHLQSSYFPCFQMLYILILCMVSFKNLFFNFSFIFLLSILIHGLLPKNAYSNNTFFLKNNAIAVKYNKKNAANT